MLATVVALYSTAGLGERREEVLWKRLAVLVAAAMMMLSMLAVSAPAFAAAKPIAPPLYPPGEVHQSPEADDRPGAHPTTGPKTR